MEFQIATGLAVTLGLLILEMIRRGLDRNHEAQQETNRQLREHVIDPAAHGINEVKEKQKEQAQDLKDHQNDKEIHHDKANIISIGSEEFTRKRNRRTS